MADESKVFDVAKPGSSKPETGSKPMIVGHKIMKDPTLTDTDEVKSEAPKELQPSVSKTIKPLEKEAPNELSDNTSSSDKETDKPIDTVEADSEPQEKEDENKTDKEPEADTSVANETPEQREKSAQEYGLEQEENLQRIIKEKTYNVHIEEASFSALKTFFKTILVVVIVGVITLALLVDAEVLDLGISLPFDFL